MGEAYFHYLGTNDRRACQLLDGGAQGELLRGTRQPSCVAAVAYIYGASDEALRERLSSLTIPNAKATSKYRVELVPPRRARNRPMVLEKVGSAWVITTLG